MDITERLPSEVVEQIFSHLSGKDLLACSEVSASWHEAANRGKLWRPVCEKLWKDPSALSNLKSSFVDLEKRFCRPEPWDRLSPVSDWKLCYLQQSYLSDNWNRGQYVTHWFNSNVEMIADITFVSSEYSNPFLPVLERDGFTLYDLAIMNVEGKPTVVTRLEEKMTVKDVIVCVAGNTIVYIIRGKLKIWKYQNGTFNVFGECDIRPIECTGSVGRWKYECNSNLFIRMNSDYLIAGHKYNHFHVWDQKSVNKLDFVECPLKAADLKMSKFCLYGDRLYFAMNRMIMQHCELYEYCVVEKKVTVFCVLRSPIKKIICNERFLIAVVLETLSDDCSVSIYQRTSKTVVKHLWKFMRSDFCLQNDLLFYLDECRIKVMSLPSCKIKNKFHAFSSEICGPFSLYVRRNLLLLINSDCVKVWDWQKGVFLYRHSVFDKACLYLDTVRLVLKPENPNSNACISSYW